MFQGFIAGTSLRFLVNLTGNVDAGPTPDAFSFAILDKALFNIPTNGLGGSLLVVDLNSTNLRLTDVKTFSATSPAGVSVTATAVPEPTSLLLFASGLVAVAVIGWRRRTAA